MITRIATAAALIPFLVATIWFGTLPVVGGVLGLFLLAACYEWSVLSGLVGGVRLAFIITTLAVVVLIAFDFGNSTIRAYLLGAACVWWLLAAVLVFGAQLGHPVKLANRVMLGLLGWVALVPSFFALLWLHELAPIKLLTLVALVWTADTMAFFAGRRWGRTRLADRVSPGKTWAGAWAAMGGGIGVAVGINVWIDPKPENLAEVALVAAVTTAIAIIGDLFESLMKRRHGFKDSGTLLPGHGGVLDRIDGLIAAAPVYASCILIQAQF